MARARKPDGELDLELEDLPAPARWREWMGRVEAAIFASAEPVLRETLARVVGKACNLELYRRHPRRIARPSV
jgi:segregation and condensation protein B